MKNLLESILDYTENPDGSVTSYAKIGSYDYNDLDPYLNPSTYKGPWAPRYIRSAIEFLKNRYPDIDNYLIPTDKEIAHVYNAKQKVFDKEGSWGVNRKPGIAVNSITDIDKAVHYFLTALALDFPGYIRKAYEGGGNFPTNLYLSLGILLWDSPVIQAIKDRLPQILQDETAKGEKKAERAAKRQEKQAEIAQSFGKFSTDSQLYDISFSSFSEDKFDDIIKSGNDVHIKSVNMQDKPSQDRRAMRPGQFVSAKIVFNEGKKNEYEKTITAYSISGNEEGPIVYSSDEFKNLPNRQFNNWVKRKLNQLNSVTIDADDTENESLKEGYDSIYVIRNEYENPYVSSYSRETGLHFGYLGNGGRSWVPYDSENIDKFYDIDEAEEALTKFTNPYDNCKIVEFSKIDGITESTNEIDDMGADRDELMQDERFWDNESLDESLKGSTKINIRESLNSFDIKTNNRYDLRNSYDSAIMTKDDKIKLAKMISLGESYSNIAKYIEKFI